MTPRWLLFDWGNTLMLEDGPADLPMALWPEVHAVEGARATLADLSRRHRIAVATNAVVSDRAMIERALARASLAPYIAEVFCYRDLGARKSEPAFWQAVVARLGVAPDQLVMIGDDVEQDVRAPRDSGIAAIWFNRTRAPVPADLGAPVVERLDQLPALIASGRWR
jgi:HAD superfamily hydrolase (TIGR01509 family)